MANYKQRDLPTRPESAEIVKKLSTLAVRCGPREVFDDFMDYSGWRLVCLKSQIRAAIKGEMVPEYGIKEDVVNRWHARYGSAKKASDVFSEALEILVAGATNTNNKQQQPVLTYIDFLGEVYMAWGNPNPGIGQFFTPQPVAELMAQMTIGTPEQLGKLIEERFQAAAEKAMAASDENALEIGLSAQILAFSKALGGISGEFTYRHLSKILSKLKPYYEPFTILDPACGSGVMLLAAAKHIPNHYIGMGLVQFCGMDIDPVCVKMAQLNALLYGLGGVPESYLEMGAEKIAALPLSEEQKQIINEAKEKADDPDFLQSAGARLRGYQLNMLEQMGMDEA